ncbi:hypothetical protein [Alkalicoccobacillus porphyridii]|uniref:Uncharacterized protein n=1 Tax=Alkalicoccobacillus porphyridii TaxID=2597270 RepID=A0A554A2Y4_9BACI|nr:hypothetical protein [Alkalicoccobacillus porphyridii]TSB48052.1 hypothetical protein FN960_00400 [Alkalicoccobacillus porphyridii]
MKKRWQAIMYLMIMMPLILPAVPVKASGFELMQTFSLRITIVENGVEHEWEYDSPGHYEYETGSNVIKGKEAKVQVDHMVSMLKISKDKKQEQYKETLKQAYPQLQSFDIRFMDEDDRLYTWGWQE